jgi:hypothetical protein
LQEQCGHGAREGLLELLHLPPEGLPVMQNIYRTYEILMDFGIFQWEPTIDDVMGFFGILGFFNGSELH